MIKATELRLGNIILNKGVLSKVELIEEDGCRIRQIVKGDADYDKGMEGEPLTEQWLIKFGFKKFLGGDNEVYGVTKEGSQIIHFSIEPFHESYYFDTTRLKYVHQLQNLIFALTGEELTIKQ